MLLKNIYALLYIFDCVNSVMICKNKMKKTGNVDLVVINLALHKKNNTYNKISSQT